MSCFFCAHFFQRLPAPADFCYFSCVFSSTYYARFTASAVSTSLSRRRQAVVSSSRWRRAIASATTKTSVPPGYSAGGRYSKTSLQRQLRGERPLFGDQCLLRNYDQFSVLNNGVERINGYNSSLRRNNDAASAATNDDIYNQAASAALNGESTLMTLHRQL